MANRFLTDAGIRNLKPAKDRQFDVYDSKVRCFGVRVSPEGTKSYFVHYRIGGRQRRYTFGRVPNMSLADARSIAKDALNQVSSGQDPAMAKAELRATYNGNRFPVVVELFIQSQAKRARSWRDTERVLKRDFGPWTNLLVQNITKQHITKILDDIVALGYPSAANHAFAAIRTMLNWCVERDFIEHSPCSGLKLPCKKVERERVLKDSELKRVWHSAQVMRYPFGDIVRLLILTGQRRDEVGGMRLCDLDLPNAIWTLPATLNKSGRVHSIPLSPPALELIGALPKVHDELVFPARGKNNPVSGWSHCKTQADSLSEVSDWTLHDLRRTAATGMAKLDVEPHITERILNHEQGGVARIYNRFQYLPKMRKALCLWADHVMGVVAS